VVAVLRRGLEKMKIKKEIIIIKEADKWAPQIFTKKPY
jgi:hypothetical protein